MDSIETSDGTRQVVSSSTNPTQPPSLVNGSTSRPNLSYTSLTGAHSSEGSTHPSSASSSSSSSSNIMSTYLSRWIDFPKVDSFMDLFSLGCSTALVFGSIVPYIPQYLKIKQTSSSEGFSTYVCLTLLIANILRIMFWFGHPFEMPLLIQSYVMIGCMILMMELCIRTRNRSSPFNIPGITSLQSTSNQRRRFLNGKLEDQCDITTETTPTLSISEPSNETMPIYSVLSQSASLHNIPNNQSIAYHHQHNQNTNRTSSTLDSSSFPSSYQNSNQLERPASLSPPTTTYEANREEEIVRGVAPETETVEDDAFDVGASNSKSTHREELEPGISSEASLEEDPASATALLYQNQSQTNDPRIAIKCSTTTNTFWDWDDYFSYVKFLSLFTFIVSILTYLLIDHYFFVETLGFVAVFTESMLGIPQLFRNYRKKSTQGMSVEMVVMWLSGDLFKTLYSILRHTPVQFYVCGSIQIIVDILILGQVFWYKRPVVLYSKLPKST